jgi:cytochrome P450
MAKPTNITSFNADERDPYGLVSREIFYNPHPVYHMLRYSEPVHWSKLLNAWVLTRYDDVAAALRDPRLSNQMRRAIGTAQLPPEMREKMAPIDHHLSMWVLNLDGEAHHRLRVLLNKAFTPSSMERMRPQVHAITDELIGGVAHRGEMDFVTDFAYPLPVRVITDFFGVPPEGRQLMSGWSKDISAFFEFGPARMEIMDNMTRSVREMTEYLRGVVKENRKHPQDNILGNLIRAEEQGDVLSEEQLLATCVMILFAGHDSTVNLIASGMLLLLTHPDQRVRLKADPSLIKTGVHEFLRYESPVMRHDRAAREDFELHGQKIRAGQRVILVLGAANRDPARFDNPDRLDIGRPDSNKHLTFGHGPHWCLGGGLACMQAEIAINRVLERLPQIRLSEKPHEWREHFNFRGLRTLPVRF